MDLSWGVLGPLLVSRGGEELPIPTRQQRALVALLLLSPGEVVRSERLIEQLWDGAPPPQASVTLRSYVSNVRRALGGRTGSGGVLATRNRGYALDVAPDAIDYVRLERLAEQGRELLLTGATEESLTAFTRSVELWREEPPARNR